MIFNPSRRDVIKAVGGAAFASALCPAQSQPAVWPNRPIRFLTQSAAGDPVELRMREFLQGLSPLLDGAPMIVDNKPGAGGVLAHQALANSPADGYNVLLANATITIFPNIYRKLPYNPLKDFVPVAFSGLSPIGLAIPGKRPEKTLKEWLSWAQRQPKNSLNYASPGNGSVSHLYGFQINEQFKIGATHVPYKGASPAFLDMISGQMHFMMLDAFSLRPLLTSGDFRMLAITGDERSKYLPDVPTFKELGYPEYERMGWTAYYVKSGTPQFIVDRLSQTINQLNATPEWAAKRESVWSYWKPMTPRALSNQIHVETEAWAKVIRMSGFYAD